MSESLYIHRTEAAAACLANQIQNAIHPLDGVHQISWVILQPRASSNFCTATGRAFDFGKGAILTGEVDEIGSRDPPLADVPRWCHVAEHHLAPCLSRPRRAEDPVDVWSRKCRVRVDQEIRGSYSLLRSARGVSVGWCTCWIGI